MTVELDDDNAKMWGTRTLWVILVALVVRCVWLLMELPPLHFDEAQYWTYGEEIAAGYYSKPPLTAWLIRLSTEIFGDTTFGVRFFSPLLHGWIAWLVFATAKRLFEARTGFWSAFAYLTLPGVAWASAVMTTDSAMMAGWAAAMYCLVRIMAADGARSLGWWMLMGLAIGLSMMSKYTGIVFAASALGYAICSREGRWGYRAPVAIAGPVVASLAGIIALLPNLVWNAQNDFVSILHVADNSRLGGGLHLQPEKMLEFLGTQVGIVGPILFFGVLWLVFSGRWRVEWPFRLLLWLSAPLIILMTVLAFLTRAHPNWAAPAYIAGVIAAVAFLLDRERRDWIRASVGLGVAAMLVSAANVWIYERQATDLPRKYDIAKKMRVYEPVCREALSLDADATFLSTDRRLLAVCLFEAGRSLTDGGRIWVLPGAKPGNHYMLKGALAPRMNAQLGDDREFIMVQVWPVENATPYFQAFETVDVLAHGSLQTHRDRTEPGYFIARVSGFKGYRSSSR
jgi:4-amino-4-deoxy-L-arabinose transferase-like glycosyltransferase